MDKQTILIIDDEKAMRELVSFALSDEGYEVIEAENGLVGLEKARAQLPDLILCDVRMEKMDGYLTLSCLRKEPSTASIPFILMTGLADNAGMRLGMELGADDYLPKPFSIEALYAAVGVRLKKSQAVRQEAEKKLADLRNSISLALPHELHTPLNGIIAFGEILRMDAESLRPDEIADMGKDIEESGRRLERIVENFLIYAQLELFRTDPDEVAALRSKNTPEPSRVISEHARRQSELAGREADLSLSLAEATVPMSEGYLGKVVQELVQNALKFSKKGTRVAVEFTHDSETLVLKIDDLGRGFSTDEIAKVGGYMQFDRKLHEQQGLGLGLSIAKRLTELHGGTLAIQSQKGQGTSIQMRLPKNVG